MEMTRPWQEREIYQFIEEARKFIGIKWRHQGRSIKGLDCVGLFEMTGRQLGYDITLPTNYDRSPNPVDLEAGLEQYCFRIDPSKRLQGDLAVIRFDNQRTHLIMFTDAGVIHSSAQSRRVVEHCLDDEWVRRIVSVWRFRGRRYER